MNYEPLTDIDVVRRVLQRAGVQPKESMGQNFLVCPEVVEATIASLEGGSKKVTELGSGLGALTQGLLLSGYEVRAIEKDDVFADLLPSQVPPGARSALTVVHDDLMNVSWDQEDPYLLVGNIPYNLSGQIIRRITQLENAPERVVLLVQQEVGERIAAQPPEMSLISLSVHLWGEASLLMNVPASCFWPQPKVNSALVFIEPNSRYSLDVREGVLDTARHFFQQKRKQVGGLLRNKFGLSSEQAETIFSKTGISSQARPQELSVDDWLALRTHISDT